MMVAFDEDGGSELIRSHLKSNMTALNIHLTREQVKELDSVLPFDYGQPMSQVSVNAASGVLPEQ